MRQRLVPDMARGEIEICGQMALVKAMEANSSLPALDVQNQLAEAGLGSAGLW